MRLLSKLALISVGTIAFFGSTAGPAMADNNVHYLTLGGSTYITDDETFADEHCTRGLSGYDSAQLPFDTTANVSDTNNKCGGEIRVEFHVTGWLYDDGGFCSNIAVKLYEGTSESTNDLDGTLNINGQCVGPVQIITISDTVHNTAEGGDKASFTLTLRAG
jgi:hypothetical protein